MRNLLLVSFITILLISNINVCFAKSIEDSLSAKVISYIKKTTGKSNIVHLPRQIAFTLSSISEDVIRRNYVKGFGYNHRNDFLSKEPLVRIIEDSLKEVSNKLNSYCPIGVDSTSVYFDKKNSGNVLLLSQLCSGMLFAELVNSYGVLIGKGGVELSGTVQTFMFKIVDGDIFEVYSGLMFCN
ncbi:hypothetical protein [Chitinophaga arvensicola]|uniref:Uncharacterized protein n=1 Tax=Chitinophaga arvensicola TaxID=29529 RepID=A0A1I0S8M8_9BACT|nr:hypothetical protein [Chitinophaga arvensicola]SEW52509.1 hypothetical protein SAMN04488122_4888 [Chitinophaga arvensicola]